MKLNICYVGWESLMCSVKNIIANGSKEVSLAAVGCLQMGLT